MQQGTGGIERVGTSEGLRPSELARRVEQALVHGAQLQERRAPKCRLGPRTCCGITGSSGHGAPNLKQKHSRGE